MAAGAELRTLGILVKYTMSREVAELVMDRFSEMGHNGADPAYLDCVVFDAALEVLGLEQEYYGYGDEEWDNILKERRRGESRFTSVKTIDITDTWKEVLA